MAYTREELEREGLTDFRKFLWLVWLHLQIPDGKGGYALPTRLQLSIAQTLQHGPRRLIIEAFRGVGKSWITVAFVCWNLLLDPQMKIEVVSANEDFAKDFTKFCRQLIDEMELLQHLRPKRGQRDNADKFDVGPATASKDPSVKSVGITGQITGSRADIIVADDIEIPKNSQTHQMRERIAELVKEFDAVLKPGGRIIYLGTPQVEQSLYNRLALRGYNIRVWPIAVPKKIDQYVGRLSPYIMQLIEAGLKPEEPTEPGRFPENEIEERKLSYGASGFALQFMLDTTLSDADRYPLKTRDLIVQDIDTLKGHVSIVWSREKDKIIQELHSGGLDGDFFVRPGFLSSEMANFSRTVMAIDPSGKGQDETAYAIIKELFGHLFLVDVWGFKDGFGEHTLKMIAGAAARWGVNDVIIEKNYGGGMFDSLLKPYLAKVQGGRIDEEWKGWSTGMKEFRILDTLEPVVQSHRLVVCRRVIERDIAQQKDDPRYSFIQQFTRMARIKGCLPNEDRLEAVAMAAGYFVEKLDKDKEKQVDAHKDALLEEELRKFEEHSFSSLLGLSDGGAGGYARII